MIIWEGHVICVFSFSLPHQVHSQCKDLPGHYKGHSASFCWQAFWKYGFNFQQHNLAPKHNIIYIIYHVWSRLKKTTDPRLKSNLKISNTPGWSPSCCCDTVILAWEPWLRTECIFIHLFLLFLFIQTFILSTTKKQNKKAQIQFVGHLCKVRNTQVLMIPLRNGFRLKFNC